MPDMSQTSAAASRRRDLALSVAIGFALVAAVASIVYAPTGLVCVAAFSDHVIPWRVFRIESDLRPMTPQERGEPERGMPGGMPGM